MHLYFKHGRLAMWSEEEIYAQDLEHIEKDLNNTELENIKNNCETLLKDGIIEQIKRPILSEEEKIDRSTLVANLKQQASSAKTVSDLKNILNQILTTIE